jgi:hypothetical protein
MNFLLNLITKYKHLKAIIEKDLFLPTIIMQFGFVKI